MAEIVINKRAKSTLDIVSMDREIVGAILSRIALVKLKKISLHADWSMPPEYCQWLFAELKDKGVQTTVCTDSITSLDTIKDLIDSGTFVELNICDKNNTLEEKTSYINKFYYFLCIDKISRDGSLYKKVIDNIPPHSRITLGINWQSRLSGPSPIAEEDYSAWSSTVIALLEQLSAKKITSELGCGIKLCMFSHEQLGYLPTRLLQWPIAYCSRSLFYDVDGSLRPCMRLNLPNHLSFNHQTDIPDVSRTLASWLEPYTGHCLDSEALNCRSLKTSACGSGCIEHSFAEWHSDKG
jgi:hypothetical protein